MDVGRDSFRRVDRFCAGFFHTRSSPQGEAGQTVSELLSSKGSFETLIAEHTKKIADFKANPLAHDNKGILKNAPEHLRPQIIANRVKVLEGQIKKQTGELKKVVDELAKRDETKK